jgi:hypothetical protein
MATSSVILDIRANTQRALGEFKAFSSQLDNKFLISGLKLDVVRNALSQINREFQRSMGEQGLVSSQSLKAAENQATLLTNIYTGFSKTASSRIVEDFSEALSQVAVKTGGTVTDIQKTLATSPFLSRQFGRSEREGILGDIQRLQTFASQAGLGNNTADIFRKIATGDTNALELTSADDALSKVIGEQLNRAGAPSELRTLSIEDRTRLIQQVIKNLDVNELEKLAKETGGFRVVLAKFSASLFNPKVGLFGAMREFNLAGVEGKTTIFKETTKLFESIFGEEGFIKTLGRELAKAFGVRDSTAVVRFLGRGINFITGLINGLKDLIDDVINNPITKGIIGIAKQAFEGIKNLFVKLDELAKNPPKIPDISKESIQDFIREIGDNVRGFLRKVGAFIRGEDISDEAQSGASIIGTITDEAGKTILTFFKEVGGALLSKAGTIAIELGKQVIPTMVGLFTKAISGEGGLIGQIIAGIVGIKGVGLLASGARNLGGGIRSLRQGVSNFRDPNSGGVRGFLNRIAGRPFGSLSPSVADLEGGVNGFQAQLLNLVRSIRDCVCGKGFGGGRDIDINADTSKATEIGGGGRDPITGKRYEKHDPNAPKKPQAITRPKVDGSDFSIDVPSIEPYRGYGKGDTSFGINRPTYQPPKFQSAGSMLPEGIREMRTWGAGSDYQSMLRDKEMMLNSKYGPSLYGVDVNSPGSIDYTIEGYRQMAGPDLDVQTGDPKGGKKRGGVRGALRKFGKGALIAGGIVGGIALLGGQAKSNEIDPVTGQPIQTEQKGMGTGAAWASVGVGAATGAELGSFFGPWGTLIGGVIGAGVSLMDKGVRDAVVKSIGNFGSSIWKNLTEAATGFKNAIFNGFDVVKKWASNIDWKNTLLDILFPGRSLIRMGAESLGLEKENKGIGANVKNWLASILGLREAGGPVIKGASYIVGERGPEIFTPGETGTISANREFRELSAISRPRSSTVSPSMVYNITINATGLAGNDIAAAIQPAVIKILDDGMKKASGDMITRGATVI